MLKGSSKRKIRNIYLEPNMLPFLHLKSQVFFVSPVWKNPACEIHLVIAPHAEKAC